MNYSRRAVQEGKKTPRGFVSFLFPNLTPVHEKNTFPP
jgi:hypothetical protein